MRKYLITFIIVSIVLIGTSTFLGYKMVNYKNNLADTAQQLEQQKAETQDYKDTIVASTTYCKSDNECTTLVLDRDGCSAIPMSTYIMNYFELTHTDWGGCDALVVEQPVAVCKENRCVFTKD